MNYRYPLAFYAAFNAPFAGLWLPLIVLLSLGSCDLPSAAGRKGLLTVALPGVSLPSTASEGGERAIQFPENQIEYMFYRISFSGPARVDPVEARPGKTVSVYLEPGRWNITVEAFHNSDYNPGYGMDKYEGAAKFGRGSASVNILPGQENRARISVSLIPDGNVQPFWAANFLVTGNQQVISAQPWGFLKSFEDQNGTPIDLTGYQWYKNTVNRSTGGTPITGATNETYRPNSADLGALSAPVYFYCEIEYRFTNNTKEGAEWKKVASTPAVVYPTVNADYLQDWINTIDTEATITLPDAGQYYFNKSVTLNKEVEITLRPEGGVLMTISRGPGDARFTGALFIVNKGNLLLGDGSSISLTLDGESPRSAAAPLVEVYNGGRLVIKDGIFLQNNYARNGGAVYVGPGGRMGMEGGTITGNKANQNGGGIYLAGAGATCNIIGPGTISINTNDAEEGFGGGVYIGSGAFFEINTGFAAGVTPIDLIHDNVSTQYGSQVYVESGGTYWVNGNEAVSY